MMGYSWNNKDSQDIQHKEDGGLLETLLIGVQEGARRYIYIYLLFFAFNSSVSGWRDGNSSPRNIDGLLVPPCKAYNRLIEGLITG